MAGKTRTAIIHEIEAHVARNGGDYGEWFVGTTDSPRKALFGTHRLRDGDACIARRAVDDLQAAEVQEYFASVRKARGQVQKGLDAVHVYAYRIKPHTSP